MEKNILSPFEGLPEDDKRIILARQAELRMNRPKKEVRDLTNAEIAELEDFKEFCELNKIESSKGQASKSKEDFIKWRYENQRE